VDPQSTLLYKLPNVLETPSLGDVSECASQDVARGEAAVERHDAAPIRFNATAPDRSPILANHVTDGGAEQYSPIPTISSGSSLSIPVLDDESGNHTSVSPFSRATTSSEPRQGSTTCEGSTLNPPCPEPAAGLNHVLAVPIHLPDGHFSCPQCPRKFPSLAKARYGRKTSHESCWTRS
jgi:hypothetical protein